MTARPNCPDCARPAEWDDVYGEFYCANEACGHFGPIAEDT